MRKKFFLSACCMCCIFLVAFTCVKINDILFLKAEDKMEYPVVNELTLPSIFSDNMVLQQNKPIKIWGLTLPLKTVNVKLLKENDIIVEKSTEANSEGCFELFLDKQIASFDEYVLRISDSTKTININNILIGEVWLASGQSNMALDLFYAVDGEETINQAINGKNGIDNTKLRMFMIPLTPVDNDKVSILPQFNINGANWHLGTDRIALNAVSAVGYHFAYDLYKKLNVSSPTPVAIINDALGSTSIHAYMSRESIENTKIVKEYLQKIGLYKNKDNWNTGNYGGWNFNQPGALFNHKIAPIAGYGIGGIIWYQGCNNVGDEEAAAYYKVALETMAQDWSKNYWKEDSIPFIYSHLAPHEYDYYSESLAYFWEGLNDCWSNNKETMAQVPIYDIPLTWKNDKFAYQSTIHPLEKRQVGERLAQTAMGFVYDKSLNYMPATLKTITKNVDNIILEFENVGDGLCIKEGESSLKGFAICAEDRIFVSAKAEILSKNTIRVWSEQVSNPQAVTYAFAGMNLKSNLFNSDGYPTVPFRTDRIPSTFYQPKDWLDCDDMSFWIAPTTSSVETGFKKVWTENVITFSDVETSLEKNIENNALKFNYNAAGSFGFGVENLPTRTGHLYNAVFGQFDNFEALQFKIKNKSSDTAKLEVKLQDNNDNIYRLVFVDNMLNPIVNLEKKDEFVTYKIYLTALKDSKDNYIFETKDILKNLKAMEFCVTDSNSGSILIDSIELIKNEKLKIDGKYYIDDFTNDCKYRLSDVEKDLTTLTSIYNKKTYGVALPIANKESNTVIYKIDNAIKFDVEFISKYGLSAYYSQGKVIRGANDSIQTNDYLQTYTGDNGLCYTSYLGRWWRYHAKDNTFQSLTGEYPIFPTETLPNIKPNIEISASIDGENYHSTLFALSDISKVNSYIKESYSVNIPKNTKFIKICYRYDSKIEIDNNIGDMSNRENGVALTKVSAFSADDYLDTKKPTINLKCVSNANVNDKIIIDFICNDDETYWQDIITKITVFDSKNNVVALENNSFVVGNDNYKIVVNAIDKKGNSSEVVHNVFVVELNNNALKVWQIITIIIGSTLIICGVIISLVLYRRRHNEKN